MGGPEYFQSPHFCPRNSWGGRDSLVTPCTVARNSSTSTATDAFLALGGCATRESLSSMRSPPSPLDQLRHGCPWTLRVVYHRIRNRSIYPFVSSIYVSISTPSRNTKISVFSIDFGACFGVYLSEEGLQRRLDSVPQCPRVLSI